MPAAPLTVGKFNFELTPFAGVGLDGITERFSVPGIGQIQRDGGAGHEFQYGLKGTADFISNANCFVGLTAGYEWFKSLTNMRDEVSPANGIELDKQKMNVDGKGLLLQLTFAFWY